MKKLLIAAVILSLAVLSACGAKPDGPREVPSETAAVEETTAAETEVTTVEETTEEETTEAETEAQVVDVYDELAEDESLKRFLDWFELTYLYAIEDPETAYVYDYKDTANGDFYLLSRIMGNPPCITWEIYPVEGSECVWEADPAGMFMSYSTITEDSMEWAAKNIFHVDDAAIAASKEKGPDQVTSPYDMYYLDGSYYLGIGGIGGIATEIDIVGAEKVGDLYYITFDHYTGNPMGVDKETDPCNRFYAVLDKAELDGGEYWTLYTHSNQDFIDPEIQ